ncbi:MAG: ferritin family protein [Anaerolineae bacterium]|nr:ferritin family protein [Anaerolineae bacterium]
MDEQNLTLVDAIQIAMEAEKRAVVLYGDAAQQTENLLAKPLFIKLADFEQHHYDKLADLIASLQQKGKFIIYGGYPSLIPAQSEIKIPEGTTHVLETNKVSMMQVITLAQDIEKQTEKKYTDLADQTSDPDGKAMFNRLAKEEQGHLRLLTEVYWNLNDRGVWAWSR